VTEQRTIDFDAFRAEQRGEPVLLRLGGKTYELPPSLPATLALEILHLGGMTDKTDVPPELLFKVGAGLFGGEAKFQAIMAEAGVTLDELGDLMTMVVKAYTPPSPESPGETPGETEEPTSASSKTGPSSSPTSSESTG